MPSLALFLGVFFLIWWCVFLALLPINMQTQEEAGDVVPGTIPSAPHRFALGKKCLQATLLTLFLTVGFFSALWMSR